MKTNIINSLFCKQVYSIIRKMIFRKMKSSFFFNFFFNFWLNKQPLINTNLKKNFASADKKCSADFLYTKIVEKVKI